jgi:hypothetical protein
MPRVTRLRKKAEIGELKFLYHFRFLFQGFHIGFFSERSVSDHYEKEDDIDGEVN